MTAGDTFLLEGVADRHLWVIISNPSLDADRVVFVSVTSHDVTKEDVCLVLPEEHPFVRHKSCVDYSHTREASVAQLVELNRKGRLNFRERVSEELLERIRSGVSLSRDIPFKYVEFLLEQGVIV